MGVSTRGGVLTDSSNNKRDSRSHMPMARQRSISSFLLLPVLWASRSRRDSVSRENHSKWGMSPSIAKGACLRLPRYLYHKTKRGLCQLSMAVKGDRKMAPG